MQKERPDPISLVPLDFSQQVSLVTALLGAGITIAAILFGVLGFLYAVFASFAPPRLPSEPTTLRVPVPPHPILDPLIKVARAILGGLGIAVAVTVGCLLWFFCPQGWLLIGIAAGLLLEVLLLFGIGAFVVRWLMPSS